MVVYLMNSLLHCVWDFCDGSLFFGMVLGAISSLHIFLLLAATFKLCCGCLCFVSLPRGVVG